MPACGPARGCRAPRCWRSATTIVGHVADLLEQHRGTSRRALIVTEGVFSMDGDLAPLAELAALARAHDAWLMADDAHGLGVSAAARLDLRRRAASLQMGTLSKALGAYGGYICASQPVIDLIRNRARTLVYSTGLPPAIDRRRHRRARSDRARPARLALPVAKAQGLHPALPACRRRKARSCRW